MYTVRPVESTTMSPSFGSCVIFTVAFVSEAGVGAVAAADALIVNGTVTVFEMRARPLSGTTAGAVPFTANTVNVAGPDPKAAFPICHVFHVWFRPCFTVPTPLVWKSPAKLVL